MTSGTGRDFPGLRVLSGTLADGARFAVSTRELGASTGVFAQGNIADHVGDSPIAVAANRTALARSLDARRGLAFVSAVHGSSIGVARKPGTYGGVDALVTDVPGLGIVALGADCAIVGIAATREDGAVVVGVAHCGWRGLVADVLASVVEEIEGMGGRGLQAVLGPTICGSCYSVDETRVEQVLNQCTSKVAHAAVGPRDDSGRYPLDVRAGVRARLKELSVTLHLDCGCTAEDDRWFSYRACVNRSGPSAQTGRQALGVVIAGEGGT